MKLGSLKNFESSFQLLTETDEETLIEGISDVSECLPSHVLFIKNKFFYGQYLERATASLSALILEKKYADSLAPEEMAALVARAAWVASVKDVNLAMSNLSKPFYDEKFRNHNDMVDGRQMGTATLHPSVWVAQGAFIGENVILSANVKIHSGVVIMAHSEIGEGTEIFPNTTIYHNVKIGERVRIHSQAVIGADGFGYNFFNGVHHKVWHMGGVKIGDDVEVGAGVCIDSGTFSPTIIGKGTKLDNQVQIGHNCKLGEGVIMCGQAGLAGSVTLGDFTVIGGATAVANGVVVGKGAQIAGGSGVTSNILDGAVVGGFPARDIKEWMKGVAYVRKLSLSKTQPEKKLGE